MSQTLPVQSPAAQDEAIDVQLSKGLLWRLPSLRRLGLPSPDWIPQLARATQVHLLQNLVPALRASFAGCQKSLWRLGVPAPDWIPQLVRATPDLVPASYASHWAVGKL